MVIWLRRMVVMVIRMRMVTMLIWMRMVAMVMAMAIFMTHQSFTLYREAIEAIAAE